MIFYRPNRCSRRSESDRPLLPIKSRSCLRSPRDRCCSRVGKAEIMQI